MLLACGGTAENGIGGGPPEPPACGPDAGPADGGPYPMCRHACHDDPACDDGNPCTVDMRCEEIGCHSSPTTQGGPCGDGMICLNSICKPDVCNRLDSGWEEAQGCICALECPD